MIPARVSPLPAVASSGGASGMMQARPSGGRDDGVAALEQDDRPGLGRRPQHPAEPVALAGEQAPELTLVRRQNAVLVERRQQLAASLRRSW